MNTTRTAKLVDLVARVHGPTHPHLAEVRSLFHEVNAHYPELPATAPEQAEIRAKLTRIRELSDDFRTPADGCEGYRMMDANLAAYEESVLGRLSA